ncbi:Histone-fold [Phytophthora cactorum]|nr:Histone-fold [Phytophthora cactorum]
MGSDTKGSKGSKRLHEDDGDAYERDEGANVQPLDVLSMQHYWSPWAPTSYVTDILVDAQEYSMYADKQSIDPDDIRLAISSRLNHHYAQVPPGRWVQHFSLKNCRSDDGVGGQTQYIPLPPISNEYGVRLPPLQYQLVTKESDRHEPKTPNTPRLGDTTGFGTGLRGDAARPPIHPRIEGSRNKKYARRPIPINLNPNM